MEDLNALYSCGGNYIYKIESSYIVHLRFSKRSIDFLCQSLNYQQGENRSTNFNQTCYSRRTLNLAQKSLLSFNLVDLNLLNNRLHIICILYVDSGAKKWIIRRMFA
jgi:hypothetical protein